MKSSLPVEPQLLLRTLNVKGGEASPTDSVEGALMGMIPPIAAQCWAPGALAMLLESFNAVCLISIPLLTALSAHPCEC